MVIKTFGATQPYEFGKMTEPQEIIIKDEAAIKQAIINLLLTNKGERLFAPQIGSSLSNLLNEQMNAVLLHPETYKYLTRKSHKKIKRRLSYDVYYWTKTDRISKYFESAKKAKNYVNYIHNSNLIEDGEVVEMVKTWCYREFTPRHKWYYVSYYPNQFVCVEKY